MYFKLCFRNPFRAPNCGEDRREVNSRWGIGGMDSPQWVDRMEESKGSLRWVEGVRAEGRSIE
jgi:hypothetical protein